MGNRANSAKDSASKVVTTDSRRDKNKVKDTGPENAGYPWRIETWFSDLTDVQKLKFKKFHGELIKHNKTMDLISAKTLPLVDVLFFADSIIASQLIASSAIIDEIYDLGSGSGFPGIVYAILNPKTKVFLVEADQKKVEFLKIAVAACDLKNCSVIGRTIESLPEKSIKFAMSRGVTGIAKLLLMTRKQVVMGGKLYHLKGEGWATEIASIPTQLCSFWTPGLVGEYRLPLGEIKFAVVKTDKIAD